MPDNTRWTWCETCMTQQWHEKAEDGTWWCTGHNGPSRWARVTTAINNVAESYLEKEDATETKNRKRKS